MKRLLFLTGLVLALVAKGPGSARAAGPAEAVIVPDGDFSDWAQVLTNPLNTSRDGDGHSLACVLSTDRDCMVGGREHDLARFAWTWSGNSFAFYVERLGNSGGWEYFWIFLDTDLDGHVATGEPILRLRLNGDGVDNDLTLLQYVAFAPAVPDPIADVQGFADGYSLPGTDAGPSIVLSTDLGASADGRRYEGLVSAANLGVAAGGPMRFHVSSSSNNNLPNSLEDNMGGPDGGPGTTEFREISVGPDSVTGSGPGLTHRVPITICNEGNLPSRVNYAVQSASGFDVAFWRDVDGTGFPAVYLGLDDGGDGDMSRPKDDLTPAGDSNADLILDTGVLLPDECFVVLLTQTYPNNANGSSESMYLTAWQEEDPSVGGEALADIWLGFVTLYPDRSAQVQDGTTAWLPHLLTNNTAASERIDLRASSARGWPSGLWFDPNGDGDPADAVPLVDSDGTGLVDLLVPSSSSVAILASLSVPAFTPAGQADSLTVDALLGGNERGRVLDHVDVIPALEVTPDHLLSEGNERYGGAGGSVYFPHVIRNGQGVADVFSLAAFTDLGWPASMLSDPDGDGRPFDSQPLVPPEVGVPGGGGETHFLVRVDVPDGSLTGTSCRIDVVASSTTQTSLAASASDDAVAAIVIAYEDPNFAVSSNAFAPCATVHARAQGLPASTSGFRFAWRDQSGALVLAAAATTDADGTAASPYDLQPGQTGSGWSVDIDLWDAVGGVWITQDSAFFDVEGSLDAGDLATASPRYHLAGSDLSAEANLTNTGLVDLQDVGLRWVALTPARDGYLRPNGTFAAYSGVEASEIGSIARIQAGQAKRRSFAVGSVDFPVIGTYTLELHAAESCGGERLVASTQFEVVDDADGDGLSLAEELLAGSDPNDADSDDDLVLDGDDGLGDTDLDGAIDALDCDSDDDGILDGVESGAWFPHPDTRSNSPCNVLDLWPGSVSDPDDPDSDDGGVPDGLEDANRNGRLDAGETDPLDPADDALVDTDGDGAANLDEQSDGTDPFDPDSDDDGVSDGVEQGRDSDGDGIPDGRECDSDGDGLPDGLEMGVDSAPAGTDVSRGCFVPDADPSTVTDPTRADTDGSGVPDGLEDLDGDGAQDAGETDPTDPADDDSDGDGLANLLEDARGSDRFDRDSDDDGLIDGLESDGDSDGDGVVDTLACDSDGDGLSDGLERGVSAPDADTDLAAGCWTADADPASTSDPTSADSDGGGVDDGDEDLDRNGRTDAGETDPGDALDDDSDADGLPNLLEDLRGSNRFDRDSDDDGLRDGLERDADSDGDGLVDTLDCDSDDDGLSDGLELGLSVPDADTDPAAGCWRADRDPSTTTDPSLADSDGGGVLDGVEDADGDGAVDPNETDPSLADDDDSDLDGLPNLQEDLLGTDRFDRDSDDDGVLDGDEAVRDSDGDGIPDARECDSDGDGLPDGLERGLTTGDHDTDPAAACFVADADPGTTTDPTTSDSDGGGVADGLEDANRNGRVDPGERNPALAADDSCSTEPLPEVTDLRVGRRADGTVRLSWSAQADACATYTVWSWGAQPDRPELVADLSLPEANDPGVYRPGPLVHYQVAAVSTVTGLGLGAP